VAWGVAAPWEVNMYVHVCMHAIMYLCIYESFLYLEYIHVCAHAHACA